MQRIICALVLGLVTEGNIWAAGLCFGQFGNAGGIPVPNAAMSLFLLLHTPGNMLTELLSLPNNTLALIVFFATGVLQYTLLYWLVAVVWCRATNALRNRSTSRKAHG